METNPPNNAILDVNPDTVEAEDVRDAHALALLALSITHLNIQETMDTFPDIRQKFKDQVSQDKLDVCKSNYNRAYEGFREAYLHVAKKAYWDAMNTVANATNHAIEC
ncbi:pectinesterase inhibitor 5-like [Mangifera indica]|uniref:pectinesterase inhibitor 5-like n=1 Tax=Mangifera indica TaxID=29780 RepID=UPI001CF9A7A5|nr:pectinesterase inhibitor 5-like [Mangifera indica]